MARPQKQAYEPTDAEKRDLIQLIQQGKNLPEQYRFVLFEDKRDVELVWNGTTREVCATILPFQSLEHIDEPRKAAPEKRLAIGNSSLLFSRIGPLATVWRSSPAWRLAHC